MVGGRCEAPLTLHRLFEAAHELIGVAADRGVEHILAVIVGGIAQHHVFGAEHKARFENLRLHRRRIDALGGGGARRIDMAARPNNTCEDAGPIARAGSASAAFICTALAGSLPSGARPIPLISSAVAIVRPNPPSHPFSPLARQTSRLATDSALS